MQLLLTKDTVMLSNNRYSIVLQRMMVCSLAWLAQPAWGADNDVQGLKVAPAKTIQVHTLVNQDSKAVAFPAVGKWQLAFFGFTSCPDICPITMQKASQVLKKLGPRAGELEAVFLSIDSDRDQPEVLKKFVSTHASQITGLTGEAGAVQTVANEFGVIARRYQGKTALSFRIEHSSFLYLLDPQGRIVMLYPEKVGYQQVAADFERLSAAVIKH
jgi:protein SCO1